MCDNYTRKDFMNELATLWDTLSDEAQAFLTARIAGEMFQQEITDIISKTTVEKTTY